MEFISKIVFNQEEKNIQEALEKIYIKLCGGSAFQCGNTECKNCPFHSHLNGKCCINALEDIIKDILKVMEENK